MPASVSPAPVIGTLRFDLPAGQHRVAIELRPTPVRRAALLVTAITALLLVALASVGLHPDRQVEGPPTFGPGACAADPLAVQSKAKWCTL